MSNLRSEKDCFDYCLAIDFIFKTLRSKNIDFIKLYSNKNTTKQTIHLYIKFEDKPEDPIKLEVSLVNDIYVFEKSIIADKFDRILKKLYNRDYLKGMSFGHFENDLYKYAEVNFSKKEIYLNQQKNILSDIRDLIKKYS